MDKLVEYMNAKGIKHKEKVKPTTEFKNMKADEKWALLEAIARDLGYIK